MQRLTNAVLQNKQQHDQSVATAFSQARQEVQHQQAQLQSHIDILHGDTEAHVLAQKRHILEEAESEILTRQAQTIDQAEQVIEHQRQQLRQEMAQMQSDTEKYTNTINHQATEFKRQLTTEAETNQAEIKEIFVMNQELHQQVEILTTEFRENKVRKEMELNLRLLPKPRLTNWTHFTSS